MTDRALPHWEPLTAIGRPENRRLEAALLTTFDPAEPDILVEEYFPAWLGLTNGYTEEGLDRIRYFAELEEELRRLKGKVAIISSPGQAPPGAYGWIWHYVRRLEVGVKQKAVQHAKLWMFVWAGNGGGPRTLEIVVSSANLTRSGLNKQLQAGWRCTAPLKGRASIQRRKAWGVLPTFLDELGKSAGALGVTSVEPWIELVGSAVPPPDVEFLASVPGSYKNSELRGSDRCWGIAGLRRQWADKNPKLCAMAPTIGRWGVSSFQRWCESAGIAPFRVSIAWLSATHRHPWAAFWQLDDATEKALTSSGVTWLEVPGPAYESWYSPFVVDHRQSDPRWSHAKLYEIRVGNRRTLLLTSANFSQAAWGASKDGILKINNFELGVMLPVRECFIGYLEELSSPRQTCEVERSDAELSIAWLAAAWDGQVIKVESRVRAGETLSPLVEVAISREDETMSFDESWIGTRPATTTIFWDDISRVPLSVVVTTTSGESRSVGVSDCRPNATEKYLCSEFDEDDLKNTADLLLEERYGYLLEAGSSGVGGQGGGENVKGVAVSYSVPAYEDARRRFALVDNWAKALRTSDGQSRNWVLSDGSRIAARWQSLSEDEDRAGGLRTAARIAAEELRQRLDAQR